MKHTEHGIFSTSIKWIETEHYIMTSPYPRFKVVVRLYWFPRPWLWVALSIGHHIWHLTVNSLRIVIDPRTVRVYAGYFLLADVDLPKFLWR